MEAGRVIAIDFGTRRTGWAVSDPLVIIPSQSGTITYSKPDELWQELAALKDEYAFTRAVIGYPLNMDGSSGAMVTTVDAFITLFEERMQVPVERWDERMTSHMATEINNMQKKKKRRDKGRIDALAAGLILSEYLEERRYA